MEDLMKALRIDECYWLHITLKQMDRQGKSTKKLVPS